MWMAAGVDNIFQIFWYEKERTKDNLHIYTYVPISVYIYKYLYFKDGRG